MSKASAILVPVLMPGKPAELWMCIIVNGALRWEGGMEATTLENAKAQVAKRNRQLRKLGYLPVTGTGKARAK